jgi:hypothetical protein
MAVDGDASDSPPVSPLLMPASRAAGGRSLAGSMGGGGSGSGSIRNQWQHLQPDPGVSMDPSRIGFQRLPHHAGVCFVRARVHGHAAVVVGALRRPLP